MTTPEKNKGEQAAENVNLFSSTEVRYETLSDTMNDAILATDLKFNLLYASPSSTRVLGLPENFFELSLSEQLAHPSRVLQRFMNVTGYLLPIDPSQWQDRQTMAAGLDVRLDKRLLSLNIKYREEPRLEEGAFLLMRATDVSSERALLNRVSEAAGVFESSTDGIMILNADREIEQVNSALERISGYASYEVVGKDPEKLLIEIEEKNKADMLEHIHAAVSLPDGNWQGEVTGLRKYGDHYPALITVHIVHKRDGSYTTIINVRDITQSKQHEDHIRHLAYYDALTGLPNRTLFYDRLEHELQRCERNEECVALLFLDLDRFKAINDSLGHACGDELLKIASERLIKNVRSEDTVARMSGDEFTIIISGHRTREQIIAAASNVARKIIKHMSEPFNLDGNEVFISASIGISVYPDDGTGISELLRNADSAMYFAKQSSRGMYQFYAKRMNAHFSEQVSIQNSLHSALKNEEFEVYYQPTYCFEKGTVDSVESLLRWRQADGSKMRPEQFLPLAEQTGMILEIGQWLIRESIRQMAAWRRVESPVERISINLSAREFVDASLVDHFAGVLEEFSLPGECVEVELTEEVLIQDIEATARILRQLKELGVKIAIDDFGTGYSSLHYLRELPIDTLKIDSRFVAKLPGTKDDQRVVKVIMALADGFDIRIIAEGVESQEQSDFLHELGCNAAQGYLFAEPQCAQDIETRFFPAAQKKRA